MPRKNLAILAHYTRVKVGPRGHYDPISGAMGPGMSSSYLRSVMLDCQTENILWHNEVFFRDIPKKDDEIFEEALDLLYRNLSVEAGSVEK